MREEYSNMPRRRRLIRRPSIRGRLAARLSPARFIRHSLGLKAPRGWGRVTNPRRALYNRVYRRSSIGCVTLPLLAFALAVGASIAGITAP